MKPYDLHHPSTHLMPVSAWALELVRNIHG